MKTTPSTQHTESSAFRTVDLADLDRVQGGSGTYKDMYDGAGNTGYKGSGSRRGSAGWNA